MNDLMKLGLNKLQLHLESETITDNTLLIFDNKTMKNKYIELLKKRNYCLIDRIFITLDELVYTNKLDGIKFKQYHFITDGDMEYLINKLGDE